VPPSSGTSSGPSPSADAAAAGSAPPAVAPLTAGELRIRPTPAGALAVALVLAAGLVAVNAGNNLLYLVVASLLATLALSGILGHGNLRGVGLRLVAPDEAWAGRLCTVRAQLVNRRRRLPAFLLQLGSATEPAGKQTERTVLEVLPGRQGEVFLTMTFAGRGHHPWPAQTVTSVFPFGLIRRGAVVRPPGGLLVFPKPIAVPWDVAERAEIEGGMQPRAAPGVGGDYRGQRDYAPGDPLSRVRWSSWLRLRRLQTKEFESEGAPPVVYHFAAMPGPGTEERLGQLAWLVRTGLRRGRSVGLVLPGTTIPPGAGRPHRRRLLAALAGFRGAP